MKSEYDLFLEAIAKEPDDWFPRLVFADWLIEQGDPRGEMLHLLHDLLRFECEDRETKQTRYLELYHQGHIIPAPEFTNSLGMKFVLIPPGEFLMGSPPDEKGRYQNEEQIEMKITKSFWMMTTVITQYHWQMLMETSPWERGDFKSGEKMPVTEFSREELLTFSDRMNILEKPSSQQNWVYRFPSEEEWEHACRAGTQTQFSFGEDISKLGEYAWFRHNAFAIEEGYPHDVGLKKPNPVGLFDMHGNVREVCRNDTPDSIFQRNPYESYLPIPTRGGCWLSEGVFCRSAMRGRDHPSGYGPTDHIIGIRPVLLQTDPQLSGLQAEENEIASNQPSEFDLFLETIAKEAN